MEEYHGYPLEDRDKEDTGKMRTPDEKRAEPLKQISGPPPKERRNTGNPVKKF